MKNMIYFLLFTMLAGVMFTGCMMTHQTPPPVTPVLGDPATALGLYARSYHYQLAGDLSRALELRAAATEHDPDSAFLWWSLADLEFQNAMGVDESGRHDWFERALAHIRRAMALDPDFPDAVQLAQQVYVAMGNTVQAIQVGLKLVALRPDDDRYRLDLARLYAAQEHLDEASVQLESAMEINPANAETYFLLGSIRLQKSDLKGAEDALRRAHALDPNNEATVLQLSDLFSSQFRFDELEALFLEFLQNRPGSPEVRFRLGSYYFLIGELDRARELWRPLLSNRYYKEPALLKLGRLEAAAERWEQALLHFQALADIKQEEQTDLWIAYCLERLERWREAAGVYERLMEKNPADVNYYVAWFEVNRTVGGDDEALRVLRERLASMPRSPVPIRVEAHCLSLMERQEEALALYRRGLVEYPRSVELRIDQAFHLERIDRSSEALPLMEEVLRLEPDNAQANNYVGYLLAEENRDLKRALKLVRRALAVEPDNGAYIDSHGWILFRSGRFEESVVELERAVNVLGDDPVVLGHLAEAYFELGRIDSAVAIWRELAATHDSEDARRRLRQAGYDLTAP
ncbi:tetratricopeptide repeat protein [bacterium]|nr:tetratricopeptide repeat protein [candidate division CSSED10-310 bacterium]